MNLILFHSCSVPSSVRLHMLLSGAKRNKRIAATNQPTRQPAVTSGPVPARPAQRARPSTASDLGIEPLSPLAIICHHHPSSPTHNHRPPLWQTPFSTILHIPNSNPRTTPNHNKMSTPSSDNVAHALAGAGGGILSMALTYPLITLSTRAQVESTRARTTLLAAIRHIIAREGALGLYSGLSSALFGISVTNFVYYYWYEFSRAFFLRSSPRPSLSTIQSILAGLLAGSATVVLTNPIWVVNTRVTTGKGAGAVGTLLALLREEGPAALFSGVVPALVLVMNPILQYTLFEQLKNLVERRRGRVTPGVAFVLGAVGKLFATGVTYPYITVKSQMHVRGAGGKREGVVEALRRVVREEGWGGLYKGLLFFFFPEGGGCANVGDRYWTEAHAECADGGAAVCVQGRAVCPVGEVEGHRGEEEGACLRGGGHQSRQHRAGGKGCKDNVYNTYAHTGVMFLGGRDVHIQESNGWVVVVPRGTKVVSRSNQCYERQCR